MALPGISRASRSRSIFQWTSVLFLAYLSDNRAERIALSLTINVSDNTIGINWLIINRTTGTNWKRGWLSERKIYRYIQEPDYQWRLILDIGQT